MFSDAVGGVGSGGRLGSGAGEERRQLAEVRAVELEEALLGLLELEEVVADALRLGPSREVAIGREPEHLCFF